MKNVIFIFPLLFIFELIFGVSGTMIMVGGVAIRHILFILTFISLYGYTLFYLITNRIKIFSVKKGSFLGSFNRIDILAVIFEISMLMSMTVIPYIKGTNLHYAYSEVFDSAAIFSLFFAVSYLIKEKQINMVKLLSYLKILIFLFAIGHLVLYFGQEKNSHFIENFFSLFSELVGENGIIQKVVLGHGGYTRVMFNTSIYLLVGFFVFFYQFSKNKWYDYIFFAAEIMAMLTTMTKSLWFGAAGAVVFAGIAIFIYGIKTDKKLAMKIVATVIFTIVLIIGSDQFVFDGSVTIRMNNAFVTESTIDEDLNGDKAQLDKEGAAVSNTIKLVQISKLLGKWKGSPIIGYGYGSYVPDYLRSKEAPFSYEMQFFALLMKIGVLGMAIWIFFFVMQFIYILKNNRKSFDHIISWLFLLISIVICVQTNPLLISFTGMSVILFLSLMTIHIMLEERNGYICCDGGI